MLQNKLFFDISLTSQIILIIALVSKVASQNTCKPGRNPFKRTKLLVLVLDGFRWDYFNIHNQQLPGFHQLLDKGVQVEYVEPIFPSISLPSWTTIYTGQYPESHNIIGNTMLHRADDEYPEMVFNYKDDSSKNEMWWQGTTPIWTTATNAGLSVFMENFARCDVPIKGTLPDECTGYNDSRNRNFSLTESLMKALERFQDGTSLAMIYDGSIDTVGHEFGPDSENLLSALKHVDSSLLEFFNHFEGSYVAGEVNVVITSDHGITSMKDAVAVKLTDYVMEPKDIYKVIGCEIITLIATTEGKTESVFAQLSKMPGVDVYKKKDIPEHFHFKKSKFIHDILIVARPKYYVVGLKGDKQLPKSCEESSAWEELQGGHGYYNLTDMRTIFFAKGPAFKSEIVHPPIRLEDEYQIFMYALGIESCADNGTWKHVAGMLDL